jgi:dihydrofolate reductase
MKQPTEEMTGKVLWHVTLSLDGFIAGPDDGMDWVVRFAGPNPVVDQVIQTIGAVLSGRRSYDVGRRPGLPPEFRKVYGGAWNGPVFVLTHHAPDDEEDATITFLSGDIRSAVATALRAAEGKDLLIIGADLARQCIEAGLIDEILVHVAPILLGDGVRFFARKAGEQVALETIAVSRAEQLTNLRFRVRKASTEATGGLF